MQDPKGQRSRSDINPPAQVSILQKTHSQFEFPLLLSDEALVHIHCDRFLLVVLNHIRVVPILGEELEIRLIREPGLWPSLAFGALIFHLYMTKDYKTLTESMQRESQ